MESLENNRDLIAYYLALSVKQQFGVDINLSKEFIFAENLVSRKTIIAPTFSDNILSRPAIKEFLSALISDLNNEQPTDKTYRKETKNIRNAV